MFTFPDSLTNFVFQYPASRAITYSAQTVSFVGGLEQGYDLGYSGTTEWKAAANLLSDEQAGQLEDFFELVSGSLTAFQFQDPWDGTNHSMCYFKDGVLTITQAGENRSRAEFTIVEGQATR